MHFEQFLRSRSETNTEKLHNVEVFFHLWKAGVLQGFMEYGLIVDGGCPVLLVRLEKSTINIINSEVCRHFKFPALFLPCKTARWDDSPFVNAEADTEGFDTEVERVAVVLEAVVDGRGDTIAEEHRPSIYAVTSSLDDVYEERVIVFPPMNHLFF